MLKASTLMRSSKSGGASNSPSEVLPVNTTGTGQACSAPNYSKRKAFWRTFTLLSVALLHQKVCAEVAPSLPNHLQTKAPAEPSQTNVKQQSPTPEPTNINDLFTGDFQKANPLSETHGIEPLRNTRDDHLPISSPTSLPEQHDNSREKSREDILIVSSVDGSLAGVSKTTGQLLWKRQGRTSSGVSSSKQEESEAPPLLEPLVSTTTTIQSSSKLRAEDDWKTTAVPSIEGSVHLTAKALTRESSTTSTDHNGDENGQITLTTSLLELAKRAPFVDKRGRVYSSQQRTMTFAIDGETGELLQQIPNPSSKPSSPEWTSQQNDQSTNWKDRLVVWLGRLDRSVTIHEPRSGELDVQVGAAQILSINDMIVANQPGEGASDHSTKGPSRSSPLLLEGSAVVAMGGSLVATPSGHLAWRDQRSGDIGWISPERFGSPVVYAIDARSGNSVKIDLIPDAAMAHGTHEYLSKEFLRHYEIGSSDPGNLDGPMDSREEHTIVGSLPNGQLYALPLIDRRNGVYHPPVTQTLPASAAATAESRVSTTIPSGGSSRSHHHHSSYQHNHEKKGGKPLLKRTCHSGSSQFPACLVMGKHERLDDFAQNSAGNFLSEAAVRFDKDDEGAVVPFFHPVYGQVPPHQYHFIDDQEKNRRKFQKGLRVLGSWLAPVIALIFVVSFEMGRRKRQQEKDKLEDKTADMSLVKPSSSTPTNGGVIQVYDDVILGYGGHGTVVFKGLLDGRQVAVKRMLKAYHGSADREISLLIESDGHPNVVRYFLKEVRGDFVYLALELCDLSLHELIGQVRSIPESSSENKASLMAAIPDATKGILLQIAQGVKHLHRLRIVHRDLKPANILLADSRKSKRNPLSENETVCDIFVRGKYVAKISDMGLGKQIVGQSSYGGSTFGDTSFKGQSNGGQSSIAGAGPGSVGWQAPEVMALRLPTSDASMKSEDSIMNDSFPEASPIEITAQTRTSRSVDIFSLGCIFYATLVPGSHPFGEWYEREANIVHNRPNMDALKEQSPDAYDLVSSMIQRIPSDRPTAKQVCEHPFFWSADRRISFLCDVSDRIESEGTTSDGNLPQSFITKLLAIERKASEVVGTAWDALLDDALVSNVQRFRTYDPSSVRDLLRLLRNKHHHFDELPEALKEKMGSSSAGLLRYFEARFPGLLIHCYGACRSILTFEDPLALKYSIVPLAKRVGSTKAGESTVPSIPEGPPGPELEATLDIQADINEEEEEEEATGMEATDNDIDGRIEDLAIAIESDEKASDVTAVLEPQLSNEDESIHTAEPLVHVEAPLEANTEDIIVWECSAAARTFKNRGWSRSDDEWVRRTDAAMRKPNSNLVRCAEDPKFRTRLCNHWDVSLGTFCPMRKKNKCVFAHGPVELRVKEGKKNRWGKLVDKNGDNKNEKHSGGEDTYGAARSIEVERRQEGKWNVNAANKGKKNTPRKKDVSSLPAVAATG